MTSASSTLPASPTKDRLSLKPESATTGFVDGAWWPASLDLAAEMPALIAALADRAGAVERVSYNIDAWDSVPRKVRVDGNVVRMGGFRSQAAATLKVVGELRVLTLLVVPPDTDEQGTNRPRTASWRRLARTGTPRASTPCWRPARISGRRPDRPRCSAPGAFSRKASVMSENTPYVSLHEQRVQLVAQAITKNSKLGDKAAAELAKNVLYALDHIPEKVR